MIDLIFIERLITSIQLTSTSLYMYVLYRRPSSYCWRKAITDPVNVDSIKPSKTIDNFGCINLMQTSLDIRRELLAVIQTHNRPVFSRQLYSAYMYLCDVCLPLTYGNQGRGGGRLGLLEHPKLGNQRAESWDEPAAREPPSSSVLSMQDLYLLKRLYKGQIESGGRADVDNET